MRAGDLAGVEGADRYVMPQLVDFPQVLGQEFARVREARAVASESEPLLAVLGTTPNPHFDLVGNNGLEVSDGGWLLDVISN